MKLKEIIRSRWTPVFYGIFFLLVLFYFYLTDFFKGVYISDWQKAILYPQIIIGIMIVSMAIYWTTRENELEKSLFSRFRIINGLAFSLFIYVTFFYLIVAIFVFFINISIGVRWDLVFANLIYWLINTVFANLIYIFSGMILGSIIKNKYVYISSVIVAVIFSPLIHIEGFDLINPYIKDPECPTATQFFPIQENFIYEKLFILFFAILLYILLISFNRVLLKTIKELYLLY